MNQSLHRVLFLGLFAACASSCSSHHPTTHASHRAPVATRAAASTPITVDGDISDWPADSVIAANDQYLYVRFTVENEQYTLQSSPTTTAIYLDVDGDVNTGRTSELEPFDTMGIDLEIDFSPHGPLGPGHGVAIFSIDSSGRRTPISTADIDFTSAPTYASSWYECRISRCPDNSGALPKAGMLSRGTIRGVVATLDAGNKVTGYTDPFSVSVGPAAPAKAYSTIDPPSRHEGAIRVMEYNVEKSSPTTKPELFRRIFEAIKPDVILLEEWDAGDGPALQAWFTAMVPNEAGWNVRKAPGAIADGGGVAIVTRFPILPMTGDSLTLPAPTGAPSASTDHKVRFIGARITTPIGDLLAGCTHLKCCGTKDSPEDLRRMAEARAINACFMSAGGAIDRSTMRILGGDLNLVGSRPPLDLLRQGLDADGSDLSLAMPLVLGDATYQTWRDPSTGFGPGRLDYILYSHSNSQIVSSFVLDTSRLSDESLARLGLDRSDTEGSDHLPVVVDIKPGGTR